MRPEKLVLGAFGPYAGIVEVPFAEFGDHGIYLITGDTGAGKTTIFDGIVFALYGEASGDFRKADMLRSDFAKPGERTFAELTFLCRGSRYTVSRSPEYLRPKTRGEGMTKEAADASLAYPDGRVVTGSRQTTRAVEELLGIDRNQFVQIAMIAQGDFLKLLLAGTEERGRIFRKIFDTGRYLDFQKELKRRALDQRRGYEELRRSMEQYAAEIRLPSEDEERFANRLALLRKKDAGYRLTDLLAFLEEWIEAAQVRRQEAETELRVIEAQAEDVQARLGRAQMVARAREEIAKKEALLRRLAAERITLSEAYEAAQARASEAEQAARAAAVLAEQMKRYEELEQVRGLWAESRRNAEKAEKKIAWLSEQLEIGKRKIADGRARLTELGVPEQELLRLQAQRERMEKRAQELLSARQLLGRAEKLQRSTEKAERVFLEARQRSTELGKRYVDLEASFLGGQAGVLAERLQAGAPCPVCGSLEHPSPAARSHAIPTEEELKRLAGERDQALERTTECARALAGERGRYTQACEELENWRRREEESGNWHRREEESGNWCRREEESENWHGQRKREAFAEDSGAGKEDGIDGGKDERIFGRDEKKMVRIFETDKNEAARISETGVETVANRSVSLRDYLDAEERRLEQEQRALTVKKTALEAALAEKKALEERIPRYEKTLTDLQGQQEELRRMEVRFRADAENQGRQVDRLRADLPYADRKEAEQSLRGLQKKRQEIEQAIRTAQEKLEECSRRCDSEQKAVEALREQTEQEPEQPPEELAEKRADLQARRSALLARQKEHHALLETNTRIQARLSKGQEAMEQADQEYRMLAALSDTANGELKGRQKLAFEQYIQIVFFQQIISEANRRFSVMTDGRYLLRRRAEAGNLRSQTGLELDVFDHYTGRLRSVQSLSGGESFKASLSLALGLSDVVQQHAGGIQLDAVFIDEGFGSLDHESLNQAIGILNELAGENRLAGIISHVDELKERIERKIVVKRGSTGSTLELENA